MLRIIIFGGTSEGRELAEWSDKNGFSVILCVATAYGETVCPPGEHLTIRKGRMNCAEISAFLKNERPQIVVDATHPHAVEVSDNIIKAAKEQNLPLIRVVRPAVRPAGDEAYSEWEKNSVFYVSSAAEALDCLKKDDEPILLTTGSKELPEFTALPGFQKRVYARVLPQSDVISACEKAGLSGKHIIAMQGPFSAEFNIALINSIRAKWLVTKESGESGGYPEKMEAAARCGIRAVVIRRPVQEEGLSLDETKEELLRIKDGSLSKKRSSECGADPGSASGPDDIYVSEAVSESARDNESDTDGGSVCPCDITLTGLGMGGGSQLTLEALKALKASQVIFGAQRMLDDISSYTANTPLIALYKREDILSYLEDHPDLKKASVLFSGDTGFYSGCADFVNGASLKGKADAAASDNGQNPVIHILPGISSFSCLCARFGLREEEFMPASAHGKDVDVVSLLKTHKKVFLLLDPKTTIGAVCRAVTDAGIGDTKVYAGIRLGYDDEELLSAKAEDLTERDADALAVMALERGV